MKRFELTIGGKAYKVDVEKFDGKLAWVRVDGKSYEIDVKETPDGLVPSAGGPTPPPAEVARPKPAGEEPPLAPIPSVAVGGEVVAPMPGLILEVLVSVGDEVVAGAGLVKMEAMKMENEIPASMDGTVKEVLVKKGDRVSTDEIIAVIG